MYILRDKYCYVSFSKLCNSKIYDSNRDLVIEGQGYNLIREEPLKIAADMGSFDRTGHSSIATRIGSMCTFSQTVCVCV